MRAISKPAVLCVLLAAQGVALAAFVLTVRHNGWFFAQGGDETFLYTSSWAVSHGHLPEASVGYGWPYLLTPFSLVAGASYLAALPAIVLVQLIVLVPLALYCVYGIAARFGGRHLGYAAAAAWIGSPFAAILLFHQVYHQRYVEEFLPQALGLTGLADFPSMVCLLVAALLSLRALDTAETADAAAAGVAAGFAIAIKPANVLFLVGPALGFGVARRPRELLGFGLALVPFLLALTVWKYRGLGHVPVLRSAQTALAAGGRVTDALPVGFSLHRYLHIDWSRLGRNYTDLGGVFRGLPLLQALPLLGLVAAVRRSAPKTLVLAGWLGAFLVVKGGSDQATIDSGSFFRFVMPGFPPLLIFTVLVLLFIPGFRAHAPSAAAGKGRRLSAAAALALLAGVPLLLFASLPLLGPSTYTKYFDQHVMVPVDNGFTVAVEQRGSGRVNLSWQVPPARGARVSYRVFRSHPLVPAPDPTLPPGHDGIRCLRPSARGHYAGPPDCRLEMTVVGAARGPRFVDKPGRGDWVYRVGLTASWRSDLGGDVLLLSRPARVVVG